MRNASQFLALGGAVKVNACAMQHEIDRKSVAALTAQGEKSVFETEQAILTADATIIVEFFEFHVGKVKAHRCQKA